jgi:membrane-associated phospholipid phosphatase
VRTLATLVTLIALFSPSTALRAQSLTIERAGDFLLTGMPAATAASTLITGDHRGTLQFFEGLLVTAVVTEGLKRVVYKTRPDGSDGESFPSGHTSLTFQSASFIHFRYGLGYGAPAYAVAAFVGFSRVHARKHFVEDVLVGMAIGTLSARLVTDRQVEDPQPNLGLGLRLGFGSKLAPRLSGGLMNLLPG